MVNSHYTVFSEKTVSTTKQYNVTESFLRQSFYPYADCDVKPVQPGAGPDGEEPPDDICILYIALLRQEGIIKPHLTNSVPAQGF